MRISRDHIVLFTVLCLGSFLRLYDLGGESLWLDEGISLYRARLPVIESIKQIMWDNHPPLYFTLLHFWVLFAGDSEIAVRFPSVLFAISSLFAMYRIAGSMFGRETGMLSTLLLAISVFHLRYAQEARSYSLVVFLTILSMYFLFKLLETEDIKAFIGYIASSTLLLFTHHHGIFVLLAHNMFFFTAARFMQDVHLIDLKKWSITQATILFLYMPWILPWTVILVFRVMNYQSGTEWLAVPTFTTLVNTFSAFAGSRSSAWVYALLTIFGFFAIRRSPDPAANGPVSRFSRTTRSYFLLIWLLVPIAMPFAISLLSKPVYHVRYTIAALPAFYILAAQGIQAIRRKYIRVPVIMVLIALSLAGIRGYYTTMDKNPWRQAIHHIDGKAGRGDIILYIPGATMKVLHTYYSGREDLRAGGFPSYWEKIDHANVKKLEQAVQDSGHVWLVVSFHLDPDRLMVKVMKKMRFILMNRLTFRDITIFEFTRAGYPASQEKTVP